MKSDSGTGTKGPGLLHWILGAATHKRHGGKKVAGHTCLLRLATSGGILGNHLQDRATKCVYHLANQPSPLTQDELHRWSSFQDCVPNPLATAVVVAAKDHSFLGTPYHHGGSASPPCESWWAWEFALISKTWQKLQWISKT